MAIVDENRQTGRTTRMLRDAIEAAKSGKAVIVFARREDHAHDMANRVSLMLDEAGTPHHSPARLQLSLRGAGSIRFAGITSEERELRGSRLKAFYDHTVESMRSLERWGCDD